MNPYLQQLREEANREAERLRSNIEYSTAEWIQELRALEPEVAESLARPNPNPHASYQEMYRQLMENAERASSPLPATPYGFDTNDLLNISLPNLS